MVASAFICWNKCPSMICVLLLSWNVDRPTVVKRFGIGLSQNPKVACGSIMAHDNVKELLLKLKGVRVGRLWIWIFLCSWPLRKLMMWTQHILILAFCNCAHCCAVRMKNVHSFVNFSYGRFLASLSAQREKTNKKDNNKKDKKDRKEQETKRQNDKKTKKTKKSV